ncbi:MAG: ABC transporter permease subunit [Armatimonadota bacterium]
MASSWRARRRRREAVKQIVLHLALLVGAVLFSFPFVWLVTTTFKGDEEIFIYPPNWIPDIPYYSRQSPYVDRHEFPELERPEGMGEAQWERLQAPLRQAMWEAAEAAAAGAPSIRLGPDNQEAMVNGLWGQIVPALPQAAVEAGREAVIEAAAPLVTERAVAKTWARVYKVLALGALNVLDEDNTQLMLTTEEAGSDDWELVAGEGAEASIQGAVTIDGETGEELAYRQGAGGVTLRRTVELAPVGKPVESIALSLHDDESWRHLELTVRAGDEVWRSTEDFRMGNGLWQEVTWVFRPPWDPTSRDILLEPERQGAEPPAPGQRLELALTIEPTSPLRALLDKYAYNYREAMVFVPFWTFVRNSFYLVVMNIIGQLFACSLVAYAFSRLRWFGRDVLFVVLLATMMLPPQVTMLPVFLIFKELHWYNTLKPLWVPALFGSAFFIFLLRQFFMTIPRDLEDAAKIDGCGYFGIYWRIMLPLVKPALATIAIFQFLGTWNEFMGPLIYINDQRLTPLSLGLFNFRMAHAAEWGMLMAGSLLMTLPAIAIFFFAQRYFIQGITLTGVKG